MAEDDPDFLRHREPVTGMSARVVAHLVLYAQRHLGGEIVSPADAGSPDAAARIAVNNVRRLIALVVHRAPTQELFRRAERAAHLSDTFCVAVSLSADVLAERRVARGNGPEPAGPVAEVIVLEERRSVPSPRASAPDPWAELDARFDLGDTPARQAGLWEVQQELRLF